MAKCGNISGYMRTQASTSSTATTSTGNSRTAASSGDTYFNINDQLKAETLWGLKMARSNYSFSSCSDMPFIFKSMFPDSNIAQEFTFSETKSMYVLTYGITPYIESLQINNIKESKEYVLLFDETLNKNLQKKQMDILVRIWEHNKVSSQYFKSVFFGHGTAVDLNEIMETHVHSTLGYSDMIQISMDGPNVNWALYHKVEQTLADKYDRKLLDIGSCGLHIVHNAFKHGADSTEWEIGYILQSLYILFKDVPARREDFTVITGSEIFPLKFCSHRWVENAKVAQRAMDLRVDMQNYVNAVQDKKCSDPKTKSFSAVKQWAMDPLGNAKMAAFVYVASPIEIFLKRYQTDEPIIPYLAEDLTKMMRTLMSRIVKPDVMKSADNSTKLFKIDLSKSESMLPLKKIDFGFVADSELQLRPGSELARREFREKGREFIVTIIGRLKVKSPLQYSLVRDISCLTPEALSANPDGQMIKFRRVVRILKEANHVKLADCDDIVGEFKEFADSVAQSPKFSQSDRTERLDTLYHESVGMNKKYSKLWPVIKTLMLLSHGQATVERSFSNNKFVTTQNLSEHTLIARRQVKDYLRRVDGLQNVTITKDLLLSVKMARQRYCQYLTQQKEEAESLSRREKRKHVTDSMHEIQKKLKTFQVEKAAFISEADRLALQAEDDRKNALSLIVQSNALRKKAKLWGEQSEMLVKEIKDKEMELSSMQ